MDLERPKPLIFLGSAEVEKPISLSESDRDRLSQWKASFGQVEKRGFCRVIAQTDEESISLGEILNDHNLAHQLSIVLLVGKKTDRDLLSRLSNLPHLRLLIIDPEMIIPTLVEGSIPAVAIIKSNDRGRRFINALFNEFVRGSNLHQALENSRKIPEIDLPLFPSAEDDHTKEGIIVYPEKQPLLFWELAAGLDIATPGASYAVLPEQTAEQPGGRRTKNKLIRVTRDSLAAETGADRSRKKPANNLWQRITPMGRIVFGTIALILIAGLGFGLWQLFDLRAGGKAEILKGTAACPMPNAPGDYRILVLTFFDARCKPEAKKIQKDLVAQLAELAARPGRSLMIGTRESDTCPLDAERGMEIAETCQADLVVSGQLGITGLGAEKLDLNLSGPMRHGENLFFEENQALEVFLLEYENNPAALTAELKQLIAVAQATMAQRDGDHQRVVDLLSGLKTDRKEAAIGIATLLAQAYYGLDQGEKVNQLYADLIRRYPEEKSLQLERARLLAHQGRYDQAQQILAEWQRQNPNDQRGLELEVELLFGRQQYDAALEVVGQILQREPKSGRGYLMKGKIHLAREENNQALKDFNRAIDLTPDLAEAYYARGLLLRRLGRETEAIADIRKATDLDPSLVEAVLNEADRLARKGELDAAYDAYSRALANRPSPRAYFLRGRLALRQGKFGLAIDDFTAALALDPEMRSARRARASAYYTQRAYESALNDLNELAALGSEDEEMLILRSKVLAASGDTAQAKEVVEGVLAKNPESSAAAYQRSQLLIHTGQSSAALGELTSAIQSNPQNPTALLNRGQLYLRLEEFEKARKDFEKVLELDPNNGNAHYFLGQAYQALGQKSAANESYYLAIESGAGQANAYLKLAELQIESGDGLSALKLLDRAASIDPSLADIYLQRARLHARAGENLKALEDFDRALGLQVNSDADQYLARGQILLQLSRYSEAIRDFDRSVELDPDWVDAYCLRAQAYFQDGQLRRAQEDLKEAARLQPDHPRVFLVRGEIAGYLEKYDQAIDNLNNAIRLDPKLAEAYNKRGLIYLRQEAFEAALKDFNQAISLQPGLAEAFCNRGNLARKLGDYEAAIDDYSQAIEINPGLAEAWYNRGFIRAMEENYSAAIPDIRQSIEINPNNGLRRGFLAKVYARQRKTEEMYRELEQALKNGYPSIELTFDPSFESYQDQRRFQELVDRYEN